MFRKPVVLIAALGLLPAAPAAAVPPRITDGLVAEWHLERFPFPLPGYSVIRDTSGNGHHGRMLGGSAWSYGWWGGGLDLRGTRAVTVPNSPGLNFGTGSFTVAAWIKLAAPGSSFVKAIVENRGNDGRGYHFAVYQGNRILLQLADQNGWTNYISDETFTLTPNRWHHVAVTVDRTAWPVNIKFWIDGYGVGLYSPHDRMGNIDNRDKPFFIGAHKDWSSSYFNDRIDEVLLYNRALASWEVWSILFPGRPNFEPGYWTGDRQRNNNCYNYVNNKATNTFAQPGRAAGSQATVMRCDVVIAGAIADGLEPLPGYPGPFLDFKGSAALVVAPGFDYHWYRLDDNGLWTHKPGSTPATDRDNSGNVITDPRTANRGPYTDFCGFFRLWSDNNQGLGHEHVQ